MEEQATNDKQPTLSVIVVSDYAAGEDKSWQDLRRALEAWVGQKGPPPDECILVESARYEGHIPNEVVRIVPNLNIMYVDADSSYELKNRAVKQASGDWVSIVDADCIPQREWLEKVRSVINAYPDIAAVSSRTMYPGRTRLERLLGLLSRSYLDPGRRDRTRFLSGNATCYRREVFLRHPLPVGIGAFASRIQSEAIQRDGGILLFDPELIVVHDFEGWAMERDIRRNHGYGTVITRLRDDRLPYARLIRAGIPAIPLIVSGKILTSMGDCLRCFRHYDVKSYEIPLALSLSIVTQCLEIPGMVAAYRNHLLRDTAYR